MKYNQVLYLKVITTTLRRPSITVTRRERGGRGKEEGLKSAFQELRSEDSTWTPQHTYIHTQGQNKDKPLSFGPTNPMSSACLRLHPSLPVTTLPPPPIRIRQRHSLLHDFRNPSCPVSCLGRGPMGD